VNIIGNLHPVFVHLPIGIFVFGFLLELYYLAIKKALPSEIRRFTLGITLVSSLISIATGLIIANQGVYDIDAVALHRNLGILFSLGTLVLLVLAKKIAAGAPSRFYMPAYTVLLFILIAAGHQGGTLTHGEGFITGTFSESEIDLKIASVEEAKVYTDLIQPVLDQKCVNCHNQNKTKGKLQLTSYEMLIKGGKNGSQMNSDSERLNLLLERIHLEPEDDLHMPPNNKLQLLTDEKSLLEWWAANDFCTNCSVASLAPDANWLEVLRRLTNSSTPLEKWKSKYDRVPESWILELRERGFSVHSVDRDHPMLRISARGMKTLQTRDFRLLKKYAAHIIEIDLSYSNFNDELAPQLEAFENLLKLDLPHTLITDKALSSIQKLSNLNAFNGFGTALNAAALNDFENMPELSNLYLASTQISEKEMAEFNAQHASITIHYIPNEAFPESTLTPPILEYTSTLFKDSTEVKISSTFKEAAIHYTLDGSAPDSTSQVYESPLHLSHSSALRVRSYLEGWKKSPEAAAHFRKASLTPATVKLLAPAHRSYTASGAETLIDLTHGSLDHKDGKWLGFEAMHTGAEVTFDQPQSINTISISALSATGSWIFFPAAIEVYEITPDGQRLLERATYEAEGPGGEVKQQFFDLNLKSQSVAHLKIVVKSRMKNPAWHASPGSPSWVFMDEILFN
jgi:uncharacterized membrane protein